MKLTMTILFSLWDLEKNNYASVGKMMEFLSTALALEAKALESIECLGHEKQATSNPVTFRVVYRPRHASH